MARKYVVYFRETVTREAEIEIEVTDHQDNRDAERIAETRMGELVWSQPETNISKASGWRTK